MIVKKLNKSVGNKDLLVDVSFHLNDSDKVGLIGKNGSGKSTLLKILSGFINSDSGSINLEGKSIKLLKQEIEIDKYDSSVIDYIKDDIGLLKLEKKLHELGDNLKDENMYKYGDVLDAYLKLDGYDFDTNLKIVKNGLNLDVDLNSKVGELSGGQKIKVLLVTLLMSNSDVLLLDEPTNNLDAVAIEWLESFLKKLDKEMIIVSHDKTFLNSVSNKIFELSDGIITEYNMSYSDYLLYKDQEYNRELEKYEYAKEQQRKIKDSIREAMEWTNKGLSKKKSDNDKLAANYSKERTRKTSSKVSKLTRELSKIEIDKSFRKKEKINFSVDYLVSKGNRDINTNELVCGYKGFSTPAITMDIPFGSRVNIQGKNGSGKTTFIKTLLGEISPISGYLSIGNEVKFGYISQDSLDTDDIDCTVYEYLSKGTDNDKSMLFNVLNKFHISYDDRDKLFSSLSPGQRTRVNLAKLAIKEINTLILDEATNHLDIEAIQVLEEVVESFNGTIISISHNRFFNKVLNPDIFLDIESGFIKYK